MLAGVSIFSTGSVSLASSDPFAAPLIDPGLFTSAFDIQMMTEAVRSAAQFVASTPWSEYIVRPVDPRTTANASSADIEAYIRANSQTLYHPVSSARMVAADAAPRVGVVDNKLKVKGVEGVRVVDASVLPDIPAGHPTGVIYTIAERAADLIKEEWGGCSNELRGDQG
jgi:choline dehydrogenase-like flavoprotein